MGDNSRTAATMPAGPTRGAAPGAPVRPMPIGAFPLPFGFLLLPPTGDAEPVRELLLAGRLPGTWPAVLAGHRAALAGDLDTARAAFAAGADPVSQFNRYVLDPDTVDAQALRAELGDPFAVLVDLVAFATGQTDTAPDPAGHDGEIRALLLAAVAVQALSSPAPDSPAQTADDAAGSSPGLPAELLRSATAAASPVSPALAGVLHGALAQACKQAGDPAGAIAALRTGIALLAGTDLKTARAEQSLELAATFHELAASGADLASPGMLAEAVRHYHNALQAVSAESAPEVFAAAHAGLATAYLTMPMAEASDQLRHGVAVGSLRAALTVYTRETHPAEWSSAQLNLANALVYAPSRHQGDNLVEAVELYEAVLAARSRDADPVGYARALANQGNALAHLGMLEQARAKLVDARFLFEEAQEWDAAGSVRGLLDGLARAMAARKTAEPEATDAPAAGGTGTGAAPGAGA